MKAAFNYATAADETILVKVGISGTGIEGRAEKSGGGNSFMGLRSASAPAVAQWKEVFDAVDVESFDPHIRTTFYANLYLELPGAGAFQ
jgi:putative alpha-1,2-mannosidase